MKTFLVFSLLLFCCVLVSPYRSSAQCSSVTVSTAVSGGGYGGGGGCNVCGDCCMDVVILNGTSTTAFSRFDVVPVTTGKDTFEICAHYMYSPGHGGYGPAFTNSCTGHWPADLANGSQAYKDCASIGFSSTTDISPGCDFGPGQEMQFTLCGRAGAQFNIVLFPSGGGPTCTKTVTISCE